MKNQNIDVKEELNKINQHLSIIQNIVTRIEHNLTVPNKSINQQEKTITLRPDLNGLRIQKPGDPALYLIDEGRRRHIVDPDTYKALFRDWNNLVQDPDSDHIELGLEIARGTILAKAPHNAAIYLIDVSKGQKRWITSPEAFDKYQFNWHIVQHAQESILNMAPNGNNIS
ncbi:hypothetical protein NIES4074_57240 [Cylindrospermum sp. NIES-4074]|nr:hypothetical protein NIES4074_57240 [Cylindrospermum sp. NIES-4074]